MKRFCFLVLVCFSLTFSLYSQKASNKQTSVFTVRGQVLSAVTGKALAGCFVELIIDNKPTSSTTTDTKGTFQLQTQLPAQAQIRVSLKGHASYTAFVSNMQLQRRIYNAGVIRLQVMAVVVRPKPIDTTVTKPINNTPVETTGFVQQKLSAARYVPTNGAINLFYSLNPNLKNDSVVPSDYRLRYPHLPKFKNKRALRKQFKKDKKKNEPYIYLGCEPANRNIEDPLVKLNTSRHGLSTVCVGQDNAGFRRRFFFFGGKTKKFVFVFYKLDSNGVPVYLEYRYKVYYYPDDVKGNEELYSKTANATYGYAPMKAHVYNVEVYDQQENNKRVTISDDRIDPYQFFLKNDLFNKWIKIAIQVK